MLKREWGAESNGKLPHLFIPGKTAVMVLALQWNTCPWAEHSEGDDYIYIYRVIRKSLYKLRGRNVEVKIRGKYSIGLPLFLNEPYFRVMSSIEITEVNHFPNNRLKVMSIHKVVLRVCSVAALLHRIQLFTFVSVSVGYSCECTERWHTPTQTMNARICTSFMAQLTEIREKHGDGTGNCFQTDDYQNIRSLQLWTGVWGSTAFVMCHGQDGNNCTDWLLRTTFCNLSMTIRLYVPDGLVPV